MASCSGAYVTAPSAALTSGLTASAGTGSLISTPVAFRRALNCVLSRTWYSTLDRLGRSTLASTHSRGFVGVVMR